MQVKALLLLSLFAVSITCITQPLEPEATTEPAALEEANTDGEISYVLTYSQNITETALQEKCKNLLHKSHLWDSECFGGPQRPYSRECFGS